MSYLLPLFSGVNVENTAENMKKDPSKKISICLPGSLLDGAKNRAGALGYRKISQYFQYLTEQDIARRAAHIRQEKPEKGEETGP